MNFTDMSTRKLKRKYIKWVKEAWSRSASALSTEMCKSEAQEYRDAIKKELSRRGWYV